MILRDPAFFSRRYNLRAKQIPFVGDQIYQVGQVYQIISSACTPDPIISVLAAFHYLPTLAWSLYKPIPFDSFTEVMGRRHKRRRRLKFLPSDILAKPTAKPGTVAWHHFRVGALAERIGWYFIVLDATTDFAVNWASMAYQWSGCQVEGTPYGIIALTTPVVFFSTGDFHQIAYNILVAQNIWGISIGSVGAVTTGPKMAQFGLNVDPGFMEPQATLEKLELRKIAFEGVTIYDMPVPEHDNQVVNEWDYTQRIFNEQDPPSTFQVWGKWSVGWAGYSAGSLNANGTLDAGILPDP